MKKFLGIFVKPWHATEHLEGPTYRELPKLKGKILEGAASRL